MVRLGYCIVCLVAGALGGLVGGSFAESLGLSHALCLAFAFLGGANGALIVGTVYYCIFPPGQNC